MTKKENKKENARKKILIVDMFGCTYPDIGYQIKSACEELGHTATGFNYRKKKLQHFAPTNWALNKLLIINAKVQKPDLVIVNKGETILKGTIRAIQKNGITCVNWNPDEPFGKLHAFNRLKNIEEYDAVFNYDKQYIEPMKAANPNAYHLPPAAMPFGVHKEAIPLGKRKEKADICLVGTAYQNRIDLIKKCDKWTCSVAGPGWNKRKETKDAPHYVKIPEMVRLFNNSKIVLNPYGSASEFICPNPRTFEIPASQSMQLTDAPRDLEKYFKIGKEVVHYSDEKEFLELVDYYVEHKEERRTIAKAGYERVVKEHRIVHRVQELIQKAKIN